MAELSLGPKWRYTCRALPGVYFSLNCRHWFRIRSFLGALETQDPSRGESGSLAPMAQTPLAVMGSTGHSDGRSELRATAAPQDEEVRARGGTQSAPSCPMVIHSVKENQPEEGATLPVGKPHLHMGSVPPPWLKEPAPLRWASRPSRATGQRPEQQWPVWSQRFAVLTCCLVPTLTCKPSGWGGSPRVQPCPGSLGALSL